MMQPLVAQCFLWLRGHVMPAGFDRPISAKADGNRSRQPRPATLFLKRPPLCRTALQPGYPQGPRAGLAQDQPAGRRYALTVVWFYLSRRSPEGIAQTGTYITLIQPAATRHGQSLHGGRHYWPCVVIWDADDTLRRKLFAPVKTFRE